MFIETSAKSALVKGFGRRPEHDSARRSGAGVRKPPLEETAGRMWRCLAERDLWGFKARRPSGGNVAGDCGV
jgi:hypothetical protein